VQRYRQHVIAAAMHGKLATWNSVTCVGVPKKHTCKTITCTDFRDCQSEEKTLTIKMAGLVAE
jgi:hypothetical protein